MLEKKRAKCSPEDGFDQKKLLGQEKCKNQISDAQEDRVIAVVVTYNRKELLLECLKGLARQTRPVSEIMLIDNASTDGTAEFLYRQKILNEIPPEKGAGIWENVSCPESIEKLSVTFIRMLENTGGAGGFHEGVKRAYQNKADWIWLMDDDVEPNPSCLEGLLEYSHISKCLHPRKYFQDGLPHNWEGYLNVVTGHRIFQPDISFTKGFTFCTTNTGCFEGMLIHRDIVEKIGFPDKRFFIGSDDSAYGFLAHFHTPVLYLRDPFIIKKVSSQKSHSPITDRSIYYGMRNAFLLHKYLNKKVTRYRYIRSLFLGVKFFDYFLNILQSRKEKLTGYLVLFRAVRDGISGRFGKGM